MTSFRDVEENLKHVVERFTLAVYGVYCVGIACELHAFGRNAWFIVFALLGIVCSIGLYFWRYKDYEARITISTFSVYVAVFLYGLSVDDCNKLLMIVLTLVVIIGSFGRPHLIAQSAFCFFVVIIGRFVGVLGADFKLLLEDPSRIRKMIVIYIMHLIMYKIVERHRQSNADLIATVDELKVAERSRDDFLTNVSHELRTPINTICGMSEIVLKEELPQEIVKEVFDIRTAGKNLLSVVSDILDYSELQTGKMELVEENYNIISTINNVLNMSMARKGKKEIEIIVDCDAFLPCSLLGDEHKIRRVLMNLMDNAIKFTNEGGVTLCITQRKTEYGINLIIVIKDTGIGMSEEELEHVFTSFSQVDSRRTRYEGGVGLGLAISQALVDLMGGFITVESEHGKGSIVQVVIPQKVVDETPIATVEEKEGLNVAIWVSMEQLHYRSVRDSYASSIYHMIEQLDVKCHIVHSLAELKRKVQRDRLSHLFISILEYQEDEAFFDALAKTTKVIVIVDEYEASMLHNPALLKLQKPFYVLPIVLMLNNEVAIQGAGANKYYHDKFIAPKAHVLVVDDNLMNIRVLEGLLKFYEIKVTRAMSGIEALDKIDSKDYDMVFMDYMMPEMDGIETMHRIRKKNGDYYKKVPIVALTANAVGGLRESFLKEGFEDFVLKPVENSVLERVLKKYIPAYKLEYQSVSGGKMQAEEEKTVKITSEDVVSEEKQDDTDKLVIGTLYTEDGIVYCGGFENYIEVLQMCLEDGEANKEKIETLFVENDWKNYTIVVHGLKGNMKSIGARELSELAKELEMAGKQNDINFIQTHHRTMLQEYDKVLSMLRKDERIGGIQVDTVHTANLPVLSEEEFETLLVELEEATYQLEAEAMLVVIEKMEAYSYRDKSLKKRLEPVRKKIEMSDYMSAYEAVARMR